MKICVITTVHPPDDVRINKELKTLANAGFEVTFIAPEGNFSLQGIRYVKVKTQTARVSRFLKGSKEAFQRAIEADAEIYHFHDPELIGLGKKLKKRGKKVIYDIHEDYPSVILMKNWIPKIIRPMISRTFATYQSGAVARFDGIVITVREYLDRFKRINRLAIVPNYPDLSFLQSLKKAERKDETTRFIYVGSVDEDRAIAECIAAFKKVSDEGGKLSLDIVGPLYSQRLGEIIDETANSYENFKYTTRLPYSEAMQMTADSDVGLLVIHRGKSKEESSPLKMYEYMALGLPQIASNFKAWRRILDRRPCAVYAEPENVDEIAEKMRLLCTDIRLREELAKNGSELVKEYTWDSIEKELVNLYKDLQS